MKRFASFWRKAVSGSLLAAALCLGASSLPAMAQQKGSQANTQEQRLQQIEDQLLDLQGVIGTLQSLAGNPAAPQPVPGGDTMVPPAAPGQGAGSGELAQRVDVIETQIRALSGQMEQISSQLSQLQASLGNGQQPAPAQPFPQNPQQPGLAPPQLRTQEQRQGALQQPYGNPGGQQQGGFGTLTVDQSGQQQGQQPAFGQQPQRQTQPQGQAQQGQGQGQLFGSGGQPQASVASATENADTRAAYEEAYGHMLRRDFASAEEGFRSFLASYPDDPLAGNAQYWLGETYYVRGDYRQAADSFLNGYRNYRSSDKAPANLLKLGMSLNQLGEKDAACATFAELTEKFPRAPQHLKQRAVSERERTGC